MNAASDARTGREVEKHGRFDMFTASGILVDSWVRVEGHCGITWDVIGDEAQFRFGGERSTGLQMIVTEEGLENLVQESTDALRRMRAELGEGRSVPASEDNEAA
jgi:hypothetical protein